jgi:hypothetical protein
MLSLDLDLAELEDAGRAFDRQVGSSLLRGGRKVPLDPPTAQEPPEPGEPLPPADEIVRGIEEFLRQKRDD